MTDHAMKDILRHFEIHGEFLGSEPYGSGHINDTYAVRYDQGGAPMRYILQRINHSVFKRPAELMDNIRRVTEHIRAKLEADGASDISRRVMTLIHTHEGAPCYHDEKGQYWRVYVFIEKARTWDTLTKDDQAYQAARMFGWFQKMLADLPEPPLYETIPDFHNGPKRYAAFQEALAADAHNRAAGARTEIDFLNDQARVFDVLPDQVARGEIPWRSTHNDTKINNVMLDDATGQGVCVIDLDTVMPGLSLYDFGDIVRTSTSPAAEDERDLSKVQMRMPRFEALARGWVESTGDVMTPAERANLVLAGKMITLMIGTRFLTDHLAGDTYFKIHRENHNLDRARTQFRLVQSILEQEDAMTAFVNGLF